MQIKYRRATIEDLQSLHSMEILVFPKEQYHTTPRRQYRYILTKANAEIWVAEQDKIVIGAVVIFFRKNSFFGRLYSLAVHPDYRNLSIGKNLFLKAEKVIKSKNLIGLILEARADNKQLSSFYKKLGCVQVRTIDNYYPDTCEALKFKKTF